MKPELVHTLLLALRDKFHSDSEELMKQCGDAECGECAKIMCPHGEILHFHHDGCPACAMAEPRKSESDLPF